MAERIIVEIEEDFEELIPAYLENRWKDSDEISRSLKQANWQNIVKIGHSMRGSGGGYGFDLISEIGAAIEKSANANQKESVLSNLVKLIDYLERVECKYVPIEDF